MKKQQPIHGALRARTRAFLCAITLAIALLTTVSAHAQIWGYEPNTGAWGVNVNATYDNVSITVSTVGETKRVQFKVTGSGKTVWFALVLDGTLSLTGTNADIINNIPVGTYPISNSGTAGTALASQGLTADNSSADIIGTGGWKIGSASNGDFAHATGGNVYVCATNDGTNRRLFDLRCTEYHEPYLNSKLTKSQIYPSGSKSDWKYANTVSTCGTGSVSGSGSSIGNDRTFTATPTAPATFVEWRDGDGNLISTDNPYTFVGWGPDEVVAVFSDGVGCPSSAPSPSTYTVTWKSEDGLTTLETDADLAADAATSFDGATPTKAGNAQYSYSFDGWTTAANGGGTFYADGETPAVSGDATYYAHFSQSTNTYTVSVAVAPAGYGTVDHASVTSVPYGTNITNSSNTVTINGTTVTATPAAADAQYTYTFDSWGNGSATVTGNLTVTANFTRTTNNYTVAASVSPVGAGSVSGTGTFAYGTDVTLTATPTNRRYRFLRWTESASQVGTETSYTINDIAANHTLVAEFEEIPVTLADNEESSYYSTTLSTFTGSMDFQLMRTFKAGMWNTVCFPFDLTAAQRDNSDMSGVTFYTLTSVTGDAAVGLDFNVTPLTTETMTARTPYLVQFTGADIVNPVFEDVTLVASAFTNNTSGTNVGETSFFGTVHPTSLEIGENSGYLFLGQNNSLYWPNVNNDIRAFRAYFYSGNSTVQAVRPRARIVVKEQTATGNSGISGNSGTSGESARKYLHNGVLVIERDGVKYNAVGQPIE